MRTVLFFFDSSERTWECFARGGIALGFLLVLQTLYVLALQRVFYRTRWEKWRKFIVLLCFGSIPLASGLAVQHPSSNKEAITYGFLVGLTVHVFSSCVLAGRRAEKVPVLVLNVCLGSLICLFTSWCTYRISLESGLYSG